jgi:hypothetical protein
VGEVNRDFDARDIIDGETIGVDEELVRVDGALLEVEWKPIEVGWVLIEVDGVKREANVEPNRLIGLVLELKSDPVVLLGVVLLVEEVGFELSPHP